MTHTPELRWEFFSDASYFDMWCVRPIGETRWGHGFHVINKDAAESLAACLSEKDSSIAQLRADRDALLEALERAEEADERYRPFDDIEACCSVPSETDWGDQRIYDRRRKARALIARIRGEGCQGCDGYGRVWNNADPTSGQFVQCDECHDTRGAQ